MLTSRRQLWMYEFFLYIINNVGNDEQFSHKVIFSDEVTFYVCGHVYRYNICKKVNIWCALERDQ